jgi:uncharacterized membrane protein
MQSTGKSNEGYGLEGAVCGLMIIIVVVILILIIIIIIIIISLNGRRSMKYFLIICKPVLLESK